MVTEGVMLGDVIDPATYTVVRTFKTGAVPQHVVPSYDLSTLWVANNSSNSLTPIDPITAAEGKSVSVDEANQAIRVAFGLAPS